MDGDKEVNDDDNEDEDDGDVDDTARSAHRHREARARPTRVLIIMRLLVESIYAREKDGRRLKVRVRSCSGTSMPLE